MEPAHAGPKDSASWVLTRPLMQPWSFLVSKVQVHPSLFVNFDSGRCFWHQKQRVEIGLFIFLTFEPINNTIYTENYDTLLFSDPPTKLKDNPT